MPAQPKPEWLRVSLPKGEKVRSLSKTLRDRGLHTVCEEASCPNVGRCWGSGTAAFMLMGDTCTRGCRFCDVTSGHPEPLDPGEPAKVAEAVRLMGVDYAILTSVDRDDLPDQGAHHFAEAIGAVKALDVVVEALIPDFRGDRECLETIVNAKPDVIAHNLETVERLQRTIRDARAGYRQSLEVLKTVRELDPSIHTKSFLMLGHGETDDEVIDAFQDLRTADVDAVVLGQYLQPSRDHIQVTDYVPPQRFHDLAEAAEAMGFLYVAAGPLVRVSFRAGDYYRRYVRSTAPAAGDGAADRRGSIPISVAV